MITVHVDLGDRSYPIWIDQSFSPKTLTDTLAGRPFFVITDQNVGPLYQDQLLAELSGNIGSYVIPAGEPSKSLDMASEIYGEMIRSGADRKTVVIALGGGVVGDLAGFVASTFMRGVPFIQVPTSLLAMVDSSVGGKVAVNHPLGKNMIGHFYQPEAVLMSIDTLKTLPPRELRAGLAEVIKYGIIMDETFFTWIENNVKDLLNLDSKALSHALERSVNCKADVVAQDEKEGGLRAILNLGHTFGHAEEVLAGYGVVLHGEAVAAGMVAAMDVAVALKQADNSEAQRVRNLLSSMDLPLHLTQFHQRDAFWTAMQGDKKSIAGEVRFVISQGIGSCKLPQGLARDFIEGVLSQGNP
jgi:3-dehydroquinate synthase